MAFDTFLQLDSCPGESTDAKHTAWIEVFSFSHGIAQTGAGSVSSAGGRVAGKVDHQDFHFTKRLDKSSPNLYKFCCLGKHFPKAVIHLCKNTGDKEVFMKYTLEQVLVSSLSTGGGQGQENPVESVSFQYGKITWEYTPMDPKTGKPGTMVPANWDVLANKGG